MLIDRTQSLGDAAGTMSSSHMNIDSSHDKSDPTNGLTGIKSESSASSCRFPRSITLPSRQAAHEAWSALAFDPPFGLTEAPSSLTKRQHMVGRHGGSLPVMSPFTPFPVGGVASPPSNPYYGSDSYFSAVPPSNDPALPSSPNIFPGSAAAEAPFFPHTTSGMTPAMPTHRADGLATGRTFAPSLPPESCVQRNGAHAAFAAAVAANNLRSPTIPARLSMAPPKSMPNLSKFGRQNAATNGTSRSGVTGNSGTKNNNLPAIPCETYESSTVAELLRQDVNQDAQHRAVLLLDVRPMAQQRAHGRLRHAVPVYVSLMLLKRATLDRLCEFLASESDQEQVQNYRRYKHIIVYDANAKTLVDQGMIATLCRKFQNELSMSSESSENNAKPRIGWLHGGFDAFSARYPDLIQEASNEVTPCELPRNVQQDAQQAVMSLKSSGPLTCPTPMLERTPFFGSLMDSICQGRTFYCAASGEKISLRLPPNYAKIWRENSVLANIMPKWLERAATQPASLSIVFEKIERDEQDRLRRVLVHHSRNLPATTASCPRDVQSIQAGLENPSANRYSNVWPYDRNRVRLPAVPSLDSDYINASHITAESQYARAPTYVVCQGPLPATFNSFWWMCWTERSNVIVMLTQQQEHGRLKCHMYWPDRLGDCIQYGEIAVRLIEQHPLPHQLEGVERVFELHYLASGEKRQFHQIHYTGWPDCSVPEDPRTIVWLHELARARCPHGVPGAEKSAPIIVHCSAGCGRSGAFCVLDTLLIVIKQQRDAIANKQFTEEILPETTEENDPNANGDAIQRLVALFRTQRIGMVQTFPQFILCYEALLWYLVDTYANADRNDTA
jgi:protein tyrosine phosphatase